MELVVVEGDHDGRGALAVQAVGGQVLEELGERLAVAVGPVDAVVDGAGLVVGGAEAAAAGRGDLLNGLAAGSAGQRRDGEVAGHGAVAVVVEGESGVGAGRGLLGAQQLVVVPVGVGVAGDGLQGAAGLRAQGGGVGVLAWSTSRALDRGPLVACSPGGVRGWWRRSRCVVGGRRRRPPAPPGGREPVQGGGERDLSGRRRAVGVGGPGQPGAGARHPGAGRDRGGVGGRDQGG